jgi:hypothetical protein
MDNIMNDTALQQDKLKQAIDEAFSMDALNGKKQSPHKRVAPKNLKKSTKELHRAVHADPIIAMNWFSGVFTCATTHGVEDTKALKTAIEFMSKFFLYDMHTNSIFKQSGMYKTLLQGDSL